jgi:DNA repair protein RadC
MEDVSVGGLHSSIVHPREVFKTAVKKSAASMILIHNHPSGDPTPSKEDIDITRRLIEAGKLMGIEVLDHVIIGDKKYCSLKARGLI